MRHFFTLAAIAASSATVLASEAPAKFLNRLGEGSDHASLTVRWGDRLAVDNLCSAVLFDGNATVESVIRTALKEDPRFYALADSEGSIIAYGFDTDGDNSAKVTYTADATATVLTLEEGIATLEAGSDPSATAASALYDHWGLSGDEAAWKLFVNGQLSSMDASVNDGDDIRLEYTAETTPAKLPYTFYLRPATQRGAWLQPEITMDTKDGTKVVVPMIANVIDRTDLYSQYIMFEVLQPDGETPATTMSVSGNYRYGKVGNNMTVTLTASTPDEVLVRPAVQTRNADREIVYFYGDPTPIKIIVANPVTDITWDGWPEDGTFELLDMITFRANAVPADATFPTVIYTVSDPVNAKVFVNSRYPVDMLTLYKEGEYTLTATSGDVTSTKSFTVRDRYRKPLAEGYKDGLFWLNEEWYGHSSGSINYLTSKGDFLHHVYESQNPGATFGATSQFGMIFGDRLIVTSKQQRDGGDPRDGSWGRLVVADANTLKTIKTWEYLGTGEKDSNDGRGACGVNASKAYIAGAAKIGKLDLNTLEYTPDAISGMPTNGSTYGNQLGDLVSDGRYAYVCRQATGLLVIDVEKDACVKTFENKNIQGVTRTADGTVWFLDASGGKSKIYSINPETLEIDRTYTLPSAVTCDWGSWRSTKFFAAKRSNKLMWVSTPGGWAPTAAEVYLWDMDKEDTPESLTPIASSTDEDWPLFDAFQFYDKEGNEIFQKLLPYGSAAYDDRSGKILLASSQQPTINTDYRFTWYLFIDAETGKVETMRLQPDYFYFPALPIVPDKYLPALVNPDYRVTLPLDGGEAQEIDLHKIVDDLDNPNAHIRFSLVADPAAQADETSAPVSVALSGSKLTVAPVAYGQTVVKVKAESNGRESEISIPVEVTSNSGGIADVEMDGRQFHFDGSLLTLSGYRDVRVSVYDTNGRLVRTLVPDSDFFTCGLSLPAGVYAVATDGGHRFKIAVRQ